MPLGNDYLIIFCKVRKKDEKNFLKALEELEKKMLLMGDVYKRQALTLDMDYAVADIGEQLELFFSFQCYLYSTHKYTPEKPRLRLIIPLSHEISPDEYMAVSRKIAEEIGMELFDDTTYEPSRLMY